MPSFRLSNNEKNAMIAEYLKNAEKGIEIETSTEQIIVRFTCGFTVYLLEIGSMLPGFSEADWQTLIREVKSTVEGAKMRVFSNMSFGLRPLKTCDVHIRLDPSEKNIIEEAATLNGKSLSEFIRSAALKAASEVFDKNILERQTRRQKQQEQQKEPYLA